MKNKTKRIVSAICALAMCAAIVPAAAFAAGGEEAGGESVSFSYTDSVKTVTMNIQFKDGDEVIAGGDYTVPADVKVQNYSVLEQYVPEGYKMTTSGDFMAEEGGKLVVNIEKIITMNIQFKDGDEVVAGGDYTVPAGVQNYSVLEQYVPAGYKMTTSGDFMAEDGGKLVVNIEKISTDVTMNIQFKDGDEAVAGGDYTVPAGVQNYTVLQQYVPEGYEMTVSGDFMAEEGAHLEVNIEKISTDVIMNIQFKDGDEVIAGGDYTVPAGVQNYTVLQQYVPEGYVMAVSGDFMAEEGAHLEVRIEKISTDVVMNIRFVLADGTFIAGGDYFLPEGIQNLSVLEKYVPAGYEMVESGDFTVSEGGKEDITVEKIDTDVIMNIRFVLADGTFVAGGDYFLPEGIQKVSILEAYLPEGYKLMESGDFFVTDGGKEDITVEKIDTTVIMNIRFVTADGTFVAGGDYFLPEGIQNLSILEKYVPDGYKMMESGDFFVTDGGKEDITVEPISSEVIVNIQFKDRYGNVIAGGDYFVPAGIHNRVVLNKYVPDGYVQAVTGDIEFIAGQHYDIILDEGTSIVNIQFITRDGEVIAGGDYFVPTGIHNRTVLDEYVPDGYRQCVTGDIQFVYGQHYEIIIEKIPEAAAAKTAIFRKEHDEDVWNENSDNPDEVHYTFWSDDADATCIVPSLTLADTTKELDYWVSEIDETVTLEPGEEFCYNDLDQGKLANQNGDFAFYPVYKDVAKTPDPVTPPTTGGSTVTATPKPDEHPDIAEGIANGTWGGAPTATPAQTMSVPQTSDSLPMGALIVVAIVAAGAVCGLVVLRKRNEQ